MAVQLSRALLLPALMAVAACGLTVTNDNTPYQALDAQERSAVDRILSELLAFNAQVKTRTTGKYTIDPLVDREHIDVAFEGMITVANIGDGQAHVSLWENLTDDERQVVQTWFKAATPQAAQVTYEKLFYEFLAVSQGVKQFMYNSLSAAWVFGRRSLFNVERDSIRTALAHYVAVGRKAEMWPFLSNACAPVLSQYAATYSSKFDKILSAGALRRARRRQGADRLHVLHLSLDRDGPGRGTEPHPRARLAALVEGELSRPSAGSSFRPRDRPAGSVRRSTRC